MNGLVVGILRLNSLETRSVINKPLKRSNASKPCFKPKFVKKKFLPLFGNYGEIWVKTDKIKNEPDQYAVIKLEHDEGTIVKYIGQVMLSNEHLVIETCATLYCSKKINKVYQKSISEVDLTPIRTKLDYIDFTVSIDPDGSIDIDDAIGIKKITDTCYSIYIHIADPTSYIYENSELDIEIQKRAESVYLQKHTYHMLPEILAQQFSLRQDTISRAFTVELVLLLKEDNTEANIISANIYKTLIKVDKNTTYAKANNELKDHILMKIGYLLTKDKTDFDAKKMVETFMILANFYVAKRLLVQDKSLLRVQRGDFGKTYHENKQINDMRARILNEAASYILTPATNTQHSSLGLPCYTHFTSPIRRYADIIVHRQLYNLLASSTFDLINVNSQTVLNLNSTKTFYRKVSEYETKIDLVSLYYDDNDRTLVSQHINATGIIIDIQINKKQKLKIITTECSASSFVGHILTVKTDPAITFALFDCIQFKLCLLPKDAKKIRAFYSA